jgi:hypothetical protein
MIVDEGKKKGGWEGVCFFVKKKNLLSLLWIDGAKAIKTYIWVSV